MGNQDLKIMLNRLVSMGVRFNVIECTSVCTDVIPMLHLDLEIPANMVEHIEIRDKRLNYSAKNDTTKNDSANRVVNKPTRPQSIDIARIDVYNNRAVVCRYTDGSFTKCVCNKDEEFNLYAGIAYCLFKRTLGKEDGHRMFNELMHHAFEVMEDQKRQEEEARKTALEEAQRQARRKAAHERRMARKRQEKVDIIADAIRQDRNTILEEEMNHEDGGRKGLEADQ